ncbi:hypothetical protein [Thauera aminoaromatica]|uniref:Uncharacterized protein n=1 Tax=Thauera aminoaromatica S2 TaxID=1234381 RepID=N6YT30_THASP|nr:hypothetical protein [Thauera aminoaromatica]ENO85542.1 hypothetical protein C665_10037 [Thauera aminoaromatica S2]
MYAKQDVTHAILRVAGEEIRAHRFVSWDGMYAASDGGPDDDSCGVSLSRAEEFSMVVVITHYSAVVEAAEPIEFAAYVRPADDGSGRAVTGSMHNHCGRALRPALAAGSFFEVQLLPHHHP